MTTTAGIRTAHTLPTPFYKPHFVIHIRRANGHVESQFAYTRGSADQRAAQARCASDARAVVRPYDGDAPARLVAAYDMWQEALRYGKLANDTARAGDHEWAALYRQERLALLDECRRLRREIGAELERAARQALGWTI